MSLILYSDVAEVGGWGVGGWIQTAAPKHCGARILQSICCAILLGQQRKAAMTEASMDSGNTRHSGGIRMN